MATKATKAAASTTGAAASTTGGAADYDAIVVGGGHNGLVAAAYLARSGARTLVLEARDKTGGAATTEAPWPDAPEFKVTRLSYVMSLLPPTIINDLQLAGTATRSSRWARTTRPSPRAARSSCTPTTPSATTTRSPAGRRRTPTRCRAGTPGSAGLADVLGPLLLTVPPNLGSRKPKDLAETLRLAWRHRGLDVRTIADVTRLMTMSIADLLDDWFESPQVKGALAVNGVIGTWAGPYEPGTAYVMAHHSIGDVGDGHLGNWGFQEGGMGAVADAIATPPARTAPRSAPARGSPGSCSSDGRATGVVLDERPGAHGQGRRHLAAPADRVPGSRRPRRTCPTTS